MGDVFRKRINSLLIASILTIFVSGITFVTLNDYGIVWDEPIYFFNGDAYWDWFKGPRLSNIHGFFKLDPEFDFHPPFRKLVAGITHDMFTNKTAILDNTRGYRISSFVFMVPFVFCFTVFAIRFAGILPGLIVSLLLFFHPAVFAISNLLTLDYATMTYWFGIGMLLLSEKITFSKALLLGVLLGLSLLTKSHGLLFGLGIGFYWFIGWMLDLAKGKMNFVNNFPFRRLWIISGLGIVLLVIGWPYLWSNPIGMYLKYLETQRQHPGVASLFFGIISHTPPASYVPFMVLATMPAWSMALVLVGIILIFKTRTTVHLKLLYLAFFPLVFFMLPGITRYDGVRLFLPAIPFLFLIAGLSIRWLIGLFKSPLVQRGLRLAVLSLTLISVWTSTVAYHPHQLSYFNELIGGIRGASAHKLDTEMWGGSFKEVLPYMNAHKGTYFCIFPNTAQFYYYQAMGAVEGGVIFDSGRGACEYLVILMRRGLFPRDELIGLLTSTASPEYSVTLDDVPLVSVYRVPEEYRKEE